MRQINELVWHCTATPEGKDYTVADITRWHKERGFATIGYHKVVHLDGSVSEGRPESKVGAHVAGRNTGTIGYVYVGGCTADMKKPKDTRTEAQKATMLRLTQEAIAKYNLTRVSGHRDYAAKACPSFDAKREYAHLLARAPKVAQADIGMPDADPLVAQTSAGWRAGGSTVVGVSSLYDVNNQLQQADTAFNTGTVIGILIGIISVSYGLYQLDAFMGSPVRNFLKEKFAR